MKQWQSSVLGLLCSLPLAAAVGCSSDDGSHPPDETTVDLPDETIAQIEQLLAEKEARTPVQRKISSALLYEKAGRFIPVETKDPADQIKPLIPHDDRGRVLIDVDASDDVSATVDSLGGEVVAHGVGHRNTRIWLPIEKIEDLAALTGVRTVRAAMMAQTDRHDPPTDIYGNKFTTGTRADRIAAVQHQLELRGSEIVAPSTESGAGTDAGSVNSQGTVAHGADRARKFFGTDGTGVKIGVLSDSDDFKEASIASGDLGADTVTLPGQSGRPGSGEGTAMMEIVHDVAPGAQLFFATAFTSPESFAENIRALRFTYHCDIIVDDIIYYFESPFQDDIIAQAVDDVTADGAMYFASAGNTGNANDGSSGTWEGDFNNAGTYSVLPSGYTVLNYGNKVISNRIEKGGGPITLHWGDPGTLAVGQASNDYDVFIITPDMRSVAAAATDIQDGDDIAFEYLGFDVPAEYRIVVAKKAGSADRAIHLTIFNGEWGLSTGGATFGHNSAINAFGVAAVDVAQAGGGEFTGGATTQIELYSADGKRKLFYDRDGAPLTAGTTFAHGGVDRQKPEIAAADGVGTTLPSSSGLNPFFGTSAAAPHAAGIAALLKAAKPTATPSKLRGWVRGANTDIEASGVDRDAGRGIISAFNLLQFAGAPPAVFLERGTVTATPTSGTAIVPGGGGEVTVQVLNNGGATATSVVGTLTTTASGVTITQGTSSYPNVAAGGSATNTTPFTFTVDPSVSCGANLVFDLAVAFTGAGTSPTHFAIEIQTGAPSPVVSAFAYTTPRVLIPDNNPTGANVTIPASGIGSVSKVTFSIDGATCSTATGSATVGLDHSWVGDLVATLRSPAGTSVQLFSRPGGTGNSGNNFCKTVFSDAATNLIQNITSAGAPYTGTFKPASPLSAFIGDNGDGNWTLNVADLVATDVGSVREVTLNLSGFTCSP